MGEKPNAVIGPRSVTDRAGLAVALGLQDTTVLTVVAGVTVGAVISQVPVLRRLRQIDIATIVRERSPDRAAARCAASVWSATDRSLCRLI
ncbi:MAG TPA: hypothetical protein VFG96_09005 [Jiangellaceae bacterium]|jgi:hypothetical protein|nr:hypothetical protein [Jiangellaceae bacterium]